jgi:hypothetical protein
MSASRAPNDVSTVESRARRVARESASAEIQDPAKAVTMLAQAVQELARSVPKGQASMSDRSWRLVDIAHHLDVSKQRAHQLADEAGFPSPEGEDIQGRYWKPATVRAWARGWAKERPWRRLSASW